MPHNRRHTPSITCPHCGGKIGWEFIQVDHIGEDAWNNGPYHCYHCDRPFTLVEENAVINANKNLPTVLPVLENGELVRLINEEHPWNNEIGLICDKKHKFYRLEIRGERLWVPEDWVRKNDELLADSN